MEQARLKYRIVGGVVLLALLAILVPVLNDARRPLPQGPQAIDIPAEPADGLAARVPADDSAPDDLVVEPRDVPEPLPAPPLTQEGDAAMAQGGALPGADTASETPKATPATAPRPAPPTLPAPATTIATPSAPEPAPARAVAKPAPAPKPPAVTSSRPAPAAKPPTPSPAAQQAWVVQLGVYGNLKTAIDLREALRKAGHSAFTEEVATPHGKALRVRVGPHLDRASAQALRDRLARETGHDGIVMAYP